MLCPKCGFRQPEDEYCARCGVHIPQALRTRRIRTVLTLVVTALLLAGGGVGVALWFFQQRGSPPMSPPLTASQAPPGIHRIEPPPSPPSPPSPPAKPSKAPEATPSLPAASPQSPPTVQEGAPPVLDATGSGSSQESKANVQETEDQIRRWAAQEWVAKGREQSEGPEQELAMYRQALEVDPRYAPAHYYLGMLQWVAGDGEGSLEAFRQFWRDATAEERETLPLPDGLTPEDLSPPAVDQDER